MTPHDLFLRHLALLERIAQHACRGRGFHKEETEDFSSWVKERLIENDYAVIRKFEGRSSFPTFLNVVVRNLLRDYQDHLFGKYRPSAEAKRAGEVAVFLERLLVRDGMSFDEAVQILQTNHHVEMSWQELDEIRGRLPARSTRRMEGEETLQNLESAGESADQRLLQEEQEASRERALAILQVVLQELPDEDQLILKMQSSRFKVSEIARTLQLDQKQLYRRIEKNLKHLRAELERRGITRGQIEEIFER